MKKTHKDLDVWNKAIELVKEIYTVTKFFPREELYGLTSQMRGAAVSIPSNIAEGSARRTKKEYIQFLYISLGSSTELETQVIISEKLGFILKEVHERMCLKIKKIKQMLFGLINALENK